MPVVDVVGGVDRQVALTGRPAEEISQSMMLLVDYSVAAEAGLRFLPEHQQIQQLP